MTRTILRNGSGDLVTLVQLADRTGIVAASAPPAGPVAPNPRSPRTDDLPLIAESRRVRWQALLGCVAVTLVTLGWIAGEKFADFGVDRTPAVAAGVTEVLENDDQSDVPPPPAPQVVRAVQATASPSPTPKAHGGTRTRDATAVSERNSRSKGQAPTPTPTGPARRAPVDTLLDQAATMMDELTAGFPWFLHSWRQNGHRPDQHRYSAHER